MRPSSLRRDRQKQYNYMTQEEQALELKKQIEEKRMAEQLQKLQNQQEILNHYKNYQLGADDLNGENPLYMNDLDQIVKNRERDLERFQNVIGNGKPDQNLVFQGDMNAFSKNISAVPTSNYSAIDKRPIDLFNDDFVKNYKDIIPQRNNENLNIINSIFGNSGSQPQLNQAQETERERRLKLREMERMKRQEGISGGGYGQVNADTPQQQQIPIDIQNQKQNIFGEASQGAGNKRDQIWQQKMQQRQASQDGPRIQNNNQSPLVITQNVQQQLPIFQNQGLAPVNSVLSPESHKNVRSSRHFSNLHEAIKLDQSLNQGIPSINQQIIESQQNNYNQSEQISQQNGPLTSHNNPLLGGDDEVIRRRKEHEKKTRQQEYQEFLAKQNRGAKPPVGGNSGLQMQQQYNDSQQQNISYVPSTQPSSAQSHQRPSHRTNDNENVLQNGGLNLLGMHQHKKEEEKQRMQREYKQMLDLQNQQRSQQQLQQQPDRRKELSDQIFAEVMSSHSKVNPQAIIQGTDFQIPLRGQSATGEQRIQKVQSQESGFMLKNQSAEEDRKKLEYDKKREYAMQLQQQMALKQQQQQNSDKRRRGTSQTHQYNQPQIQENHVIPQNKQVFEYQNPLLMQQMQEHSQQFQPVQNVYNQMTYDNNYNAQSLLPMNQQFIQPQIAPLQQNNFNFSPMALQQNSPLSYPQQIQMPMQVFEPQKNAVTELSQQQLQRQKQEEYRRELEMQIKMKEEQKKMKEAEQQFFEQKQDLEFARMAQEYNNPQIPQQIHQNSVPEIYNQQLQQQQLPSSAQNFVRQRTDVSKRGEPEKDQQAKLKQLQYQEELQRQMEEKKRQKEEEKKRLKQEEEEEERRLQMEQQFLKQKENKELINEGKNVPQEEKKRNVRRDLFEPSSDNPNIKNQKSSSHIDPQQQEWQKPSQQIERENIFSNENNFNNQKGFELPINNRREDLFGGQVQQAYPSESNFQNLGTNNQIMNNNDFINKREQLFGGNGFISQQPTFLQFEQPKQQQQQFQNNPMDEEYGKMIFMYQKAFQEIIDFKNSYFEEVMKMREKMIREREELLEYEKIKHQQNLEIQNLKAVYNRLGDLVTPQYNNNNTQGSSGTTQIMNPAMQHNLDNFLMKQKQDIMRLSQSGTGFKFTQNNPSQPQYSQPQYQPPIQQTSQPHPYIINQQPEEKVNILEQSLSSDTKFVIVQKNPQQMIGNSQLLQTWKQEQINQHQPQQTNQLYNQSMVQSLAGSSHFINNQTPQKIGGILAGSQKAMTGFHSRPQTSNPPETIQELPKEEDDQVNSSKHTLNNKLTSREAAEDLDFNSRDTSHSPERQEQMDGLDKVPSQKLMATQNNSMSTVKQNGITSTNPLGNTTTIQDNMLQIERMISGNHNVTSNGFNSFAQNSNQRQKSPNKTAEKFNNHAQATGSSFYNATIQHQKIQEQVQMEELQKQLMRIYGVSSQISEKNNVESQNFMNKVQQEEANKQMHAQSKFEVIKQHQYQHPSSSQSQRQQISQQQQQKNQQQQQQQQVFINPLQKAALMERINQMTMNSDEKDLLMQSNINIAESMTGSQNIGALINQANQHIFTNNPQYHHQNYQNYSNKQEFNRDYNQKNNNDDLEEVQSEEQENNDASCDYEVQEVSMNEKPMIYEQKKYFEDTQFSQQQQDDDVWNDPDLVPPPVVLMNNDEYDDDDHYFNPQIINDESSSQMMEGDYNMEKGGNQSAIHDGTLQNLEMFSPPSDENNFNLGTYDQQSNHSNCFAHSATNFQNPYQQQQDQQPLQPPRTQQSQMSYQERRDARKQQMSINKPPSMYNDKDDILSDDKSVTKKEREILELTKLIQKATDTTNNLFEHSDNFKFRFKKEQILKPPENNESSSLPPHNIKKQSQLQPPTQVTRKNIKTVDPFKIAEQKQQNSTMQQQFPPQQQDKDNEILSNLDKMIMNLQEQQQKCNEMSLKYQQDQAQQQMSQEQDFEYNIGIQHQQQQQYEDGNKEIKLQTQQIRGRPISGIPRITGSDNHSKSNKKNRPVSAFDQDNQGKLGKYAQMAMKSNEKQKSQKSLGKFAQMAANSAKADADIINEVTSKYGKDSQQNNNVIIDQQNQQQQILRPVSGKSNSNRYQVVTKQSNRSNSKNRTGQMYFDEESEDLSGFNIGQADNIIDNNDEQ